MDTLRDTELTKGEYVRVIIEGQVFAVGDEGYLEIWGDNQKLSVGGSDGRPFPWLTGARVQKIDPFDDAPASLTDPSDGFGLEGAIDQAVFEALGAASACWENLPGAGVFESDRCKAIGDRLVSVLAAREARLRAELGAS